MKRLYFPAFWRNIRVLGSSLSCWVKEKRACCGEEQRQFQLWIDILLFLAILSNSSLKVQLVFGFPVLRHIHQWRDAGLMASGDGQWWLGKVAGFSGAVCLPAASGERPNAAAAQAAIRYQVLSLCLASSSLCFPPEWITVWPCVCLLILPALNPSLLLPVPPSWFCFGEHSSLNVNLWETCT